MKKQLLIVACATFSFFTATAKPTNAELLAHLKQVKTVIEKDLQYVSNAKNELQQKLGQDYITLTNILHEFFDITELTKFLSKLEKIGFYRACNELKPIHSVLDFIQNSDDETAKRILAELNIGDFDTKILELTHTDFINIMGSLVNKHCSQNNIEHITSLVLTDDMVDLNYLIMQNEIITTLLQDIENKIKELQKR